MRTGAPYLVTADNQPVKVTNDKAVAETDVLKEALTKNVALSYVTLYDDKDNEVTAPPAPCVLMVVWKARP